MALAPIAHCVETSKFILIRIRPVLPNVFIGTTYTPTFISSSDNILPHANEHNGQSETEDITEFSTVTTTSPSEYTPSSAGFTAVGKPKSPVAWLSVLAFKNLS